MRARLLLCVVLTLIGCPRADGLDTSAARQFYGQSTEVQKKTLRQYSLEDQLRLFLFGNQVRHPPAIYLARCFALNGAGAVELLRSRLTGETDDLTVRDIAMLLATIDAMGQYDVANDAPLMSALRSRVSQMHDAGWRDTAERHFDSIGHERNDQADAVHDCD